MRTKRSSFRPIASVACSACEKLDGKFVPQRTEQTRNDGRRHGDRAEQVTPLHLRRPGSHVTLSRRVRPQVKQIDFII